MSQTRHRRYTGLQVDRLVQAAERRGREEALLEHQAAVEASQPRRITRADVAGMNADQINANWAEVSAVLAQEEAGTPEQGDE